MAQITKWDYGFAEYDGSAIHRRIGSMDDVATAEGLVPLVPFMIAAGEKGWEFCGTLPAPVSQSGPGSPLSIAVLFKRPIDG
jgi:hypothetical protein